jgi:hypothetical protein
MQPTFTCWTKLFSFSCAQFYFCCLQASIVQLFLIIFISESSQWGASCTYFSKKMSNCRHKKQTSIHPNDKRATTRTVYRSSFERLQKCCKTKPFHVAPVGEEMLGGQSSIINLDSMLHQLVKKYCYLEH